MTKIKHSLDKHTEPLKLYYQTELGSLRNQNSTLKLCVIAHIAFKVFFILSLVGGTEKLPKS